jgi:hypothetical protein
MEKGQMRKSHRKSILRKARKLIKQEIENFDDLLGGEKETIEDEYIEKVCKERGWKLSHFYAISGKELDDLMS